MKPQLLGRKVFDGVVGDASEEFLVQGAEYFAIEVRNSAAAISVKAGLMEPFAVALTSALDLKVLEGNITTPGLWHVFGGPYSKVGVEAVGLTGAESIVVGAQ